VICDSLKTHPTIEACDFHGSYDHPPSSAQVPDIYNLGYNENEHFDRHEYICMTVTASIICLAVQVMDGDLFRGTAVDCGAAETVPGICRRLGSEEIQGCSIHCEVTFRILWLMLQAFSTPLDRVAVFRLVL
jgi:hypothetical protein